MPRRFEHVSGSSSKFWEVSVSGTEVVVRYGKIGTTGQAKTKDHGTEEKAAKESDKLVRQKTKKGYVEVADSDTATPAAPDEVAALREGGEELLLSLGELTLLDADQEPGLVANFEADDDGNRWKQVFTAISWVAEEANGGAIGYWQPSSDARCVVYLDNEGQLRLTGPTVIDHLCWYDQQGKQTRLIKRFCADQDLPAPLSASARKRAVAGFETPLQRFDGLAKKKPRGAKPPAKAKKVKKGPRPFSKAIASCSLPDGRVFVVTGEDFGGAYGKEKVTKGATFLFDPETMTFSTADPLDAEFYTIRHALPSGPGRVRLLEPRFVWEDGSWSADEGPELPTDFGSELYRLQDGSALLFGTTEYDRRVFRLIGDEITAIGELPYPRGYDAMVQLPDGRLWFGAGEAQGEDYFGSTDKTVILDPKSWTFREGPALPVTYTMRGAFFALAGGRTWTADSGQNVHVFDGKAWEDRGESEVLKSTCNFHGLPDGSFFSVRQEDGLIVRIDPDTGEATEAATLRLGQQEAHVHPLPDGRVLFVGGVLFGNREAEPEIWDPSANEVSCIPGHDGSVARQEKALAKEREKRAKRGY